MKKILLIVVLCFLFLTGKGISNPSVFNSRGNSEKGSWVLRSPSVDSIIAYGKEFLGKPYRYRGPASWPLDCSGYISHIFGKFNISLPHSSGGIAKVIDNIPLADVRKGDLLFFKGSNRRRSSVGHVSLVIGIEEGKIRMMHSCSRGIIIEEYNSLEYYTTRFLMAGRIHQVAFENQPGIVPFLVPDTLPETSIRKDTLSIIGVGDMMLGTNYPSDSYLPPKDGRDILSPVKDLLVDADITFGNLEGVLLTAQGKVKTCIDPKICYAFKSPDHYVNYFKDAGFDILNVANNHFNDFGEPGRLNTLKLLEEAQIHYAGLLKVPYTIFDKDSVRYGFCGFSPASGTVSITDLSNATKIVKQLDSLCDIVIVSFHGGAEGSKYSHVTRECETFLGENRGNPYEFAKTVIDAGADLVFGHGPHVTRAINVYKDRFIAYSLGNFATYARFNLSGISGLAPIIKVKVNRKGEFLEANIFSTRQVGEGGPMLDEEQKVLKEIINLTLTDIPEAPVTISETGLVKRK